MDFLTKDSEDLSNVLYNTPNDSVGDVFAAVAAEGRIKTYFYYNLIFIVV